MNERHTGEHLGQPLFLDETPDLHRRKQPEPNNVDVLFADEDALPPRAGSASARRQALSLPDSWSAISDHLKSPAMERFRGVLLAALILAAAIFGFFAARILLI